MIDSIPLCQVALIARAHADSWSEDAPFNMRVAVGSERLANDARGGPGTAYSYGSTDPAYVVALDGHFECVPPRCQASAPAGTPSTTIPPTEVPVSTMVFSLDPATLRPVGGFSVGRQVDLSQMGNVYNIDRY